MNIQIRDFEVQDYEAALKLWRSDANIGLSSADLEDNLQLFLKRNPGLSKIAICEGRLVGTVLCGQDGRRGYLYHLQVDEQYRRQGIGRSLVNACLDGLRKENIQKCHLFVFDTNRSGKDFWQGAGWQERKDIAVFSKDL